ncbi:hypothetical protein PENSPDRAFT_15380 [Peniophora sp. CONT]|nr:hypothetical protein PENSPDRAFT_15380 [Peniophora sp. CONT]
MMTPDPDTVDPYAWTKDAPPTPEIDEGRINSLAKRHRTLVDASDLNQEDIRRVEFEITEIEYRTSVTLPELDVKDGFLVGDIEVMRNDSSKIRDVQEVPWTDGWDGMHYERGKIQCKRILLDWEKSVLIKQLEEEKEIEKRVEDRMREWIYDVLTVRTPTRNVN